MEQEENSRLSLVKMGASMIIFGTIGIFRTYIPLSSAMLACVRGIGGALFLLVWVKLLKKQSAFTLSGKEKLFFVFTGCLIGLNWMFLFEAYRYTGVQTATLCYYMQPVIVTLVSPFLFNEKLTGLRLGCAAAAVLGMFLITGTGNADLRGIAYGLAAALLYAGVVIFNKKAPAAGAFEKTILQLGAAGAIMIPYLLFTGTGEPVSINALTVILTLIVCLVHTGIAYLLYFGAVKGLKAQTAAVMGYIDPVSALFLSALILHEQLSAAAVCGAVLIIASALISQLSKQN